MKFIKESIPYILIILAVILIRSYIVTPVRVDGDSMKPSFEDGQIVLLSKYYKKYERMDVIVFHYNGERLIKRVIGLPGEKVKIKDNNIYINDEIIPDYADNVKTSDYTLEVTIPEGYYFVLGDNRSSSLDSRVIGLINEKKISGRVTFRLFPFNKITKI